MLIDRLDGFGVDGSRQRNGTAHLALVPLAADIRFLLDLLLFLLFFPYFFLLPEYQIERRKAQGYRIS